MMNITIVAVGNLKEKYFRDASAEYEKRLSAMCKMNIIEVKEERSPDNPSPAQIDSIIEKEGERIMEKIPKGSALITLCIEGKEYASPDFSRLIEKIAFDHSSICFAIGGSFGLSDHVKRYAKYHLSFGKMTLTHQLSRIVLLEQIYRAFSIQNHSKYHK